jgi:hypothetical protein
VKWSDGCGTSRTIVVGSAAAAAASASDWVTAPSSTMRRSTCARRAVASSGRPIGSKRCGLEINPARSAASGSVTSARGLPKYLVTAALTP